LHDDLQRQSHKPNGPPPPSHLSAGTDLRAHELAHSPDLQRQSRLANVSCEWSRGLYEISPAIQVTKIDTDWFDCRHATVLVPGK
jgi:hypothetical protein